MNHEIDTIVSASNAAPAGGAVQADSGELAAGTYDVTANLVSMDTVAVGKGMVLEHRNAANSATLKQLGGVNASGAIQINIKGLVVGAGERVRVIAGSAAGAASSLYVSSIALTKMR